MSAWIDLLDPVTREKAEHLIRFLTEQGLGDAEDWVRSEIEERIPQVARFLMLRTFWESMIDVYQNSAVWIQRCITEAEKNPHGYFADAGQALKRMVETGVDNADIGRVARMVAYETV